MNQPPDPASDDLVRTVSFADVFASIVAMRLLVATLTGLGLAASIALAFLLHVRYTAETRITGQSSTRTALPAGLAGLAGQLGLSLDAATGTTPPQFYVDLLQSREIRESLLRTPFAVGGDSSRRQTLIEQLDFSGRTPALRLDKGVRYLKKRTSIEAAKSGIISIQVTMPDAQLAAEVANRMIELLNEFNVERLQFQSRQQRIFSEQRLHEAEAELLAAERTHQAFLERNRVITASPALQTEAARLQRTIQTKQEVFLMLTRSYEEARIAEAKDVPTVTVVDRAAPPARRSWPIRWLVVLAGAGVGVLLGILTALVRDAMRRAREAKRPAYDRLVEAFASAESPPRMAQPSQSGAHR